MLSINFIEMGCSVSHFEASDPLAASVKKVIPFPESNFLSEPIANPEECYFKHISFQFKSEQAPITTSPLRPHRRTSNITQESQLTEVDRTSINPKSHEYPFDCIGVLQFQSTIKAQKPPNSDQLEGFQLIQGIGNGFLISSTLVLTAGHVIDFYQQNNGNQFKFLPNKLTSNKMRTSSIDIKRYRRIKLRSDISFEQDYAIIEIEKQIEKSRYIPLGYDYNLLETQALLAGFKRSSDNQDFRQTWMKGLIKKLTPQQIYYDIDTEFGQSGAPLFVDLGNQNFFAIGIHVGQDDQPYNSACKITDAMINQIKEWRGQVNGLNFFASLKMPSLFEQALEPSLNPPIQDLIIKYEESDVFSKPQAAVKQIEQQTNNNRAHPHLRTIHQQLQSNDEAISIQQNPPSNEQQLRRQSRTSQHFSSFLHDKTIDELFEICKYQYRSQMYHKSLLLCQHILERFAPFVGIPYKKIMVENLMAMNYHNLDQSSIAIAILSNLTIENQQDNLKVILYNNISSIYFDLNKLNKAFAFLKQAQRINDQLRAEQSHQHLKLGYNLGIADLAKDSVDSAISKIQSAIIQHKHSYPRQKRQLSEMFEVLSFLYHSIEQYQLWLTNAYKGLIFLKEFYQERLRFDHDKRQVKNSRKVDCYLAQKYPRFGEKQNLFVKQALELAKDHRISLELFIEALMMIKKVLAEDQNIEIRQSWLMGIELFKEQLFQQDEPL